MVTCGSQRVKTNSKRYFDVCDIYFCNFFDYLSKNQFVACFHLQVKTFYFSFIICDQRMLSNLLLSQYGSS